MAWTCDGDAPGTQYTHAHELHDGHPHAHAHSDEGHSHSGVDFVPFMTAFNTGLDPRSGTFGKKFINYFMTSVWSARHFGTPVHVVTHGDDTKFRNAVAMSKADGLQLDYVSFHNYNLCEQDKLFGCPTSFVDAVDQLKRIHTASGKVGSNMVYFEMDMIMRQVRAAQGWAGARYMPMQRFEAHTPPFLLLAGLFFVRDFLRARQLPGFIFSPPVSGAGCTPRALYYCLALSSTVSTNTP